MSTHTPTPWKIDQQDSSTGNGPFDMPGDVNHVFTCQTGFSHEPLERCEANAARIVACVNALADRDPSKLDALENVCYRLIDVGVPPGMREIIGELEAALAAFRKEVQS